MLHAHTCFPVIILFLTKRHHVIALLLAASGFLFNLLIISHDMPVRINAVGCSWAMPRIQKGLQRAAESADPTALYHSSPIYSVGKLKGTRYDFIGCLGLLAQSGRELVMVDCN